MINKTFIHIKGISKEKEKQIWKEGINSWEDLIENYDNINLPFKDKIKNEVISSINELKKNNLSFFANSLPKKEHWRMYQHLKDKVCFLDIETTGLNKSQDIITLIGLFNGKDTRIFVEGKNMKNFSKEISKYDMVITFNGACFDLPFIKNKHNSISLPKFHVDLRFALRRLGYAGGLKNIEREFGIIRDESIKDIDGFEAIRLWKAYKNGDNKALTKLIDYNVADIKNLKNLMDFTFYVFSKETFFLS